VDAAVSAARLSAGPCRTASIPLVGAATVASLASIQAPRTLVRRYGTEARLVLAIAETMAGGLEPIADGIDVCAAELAFSVRYEGARSADDLLDRRTRIGLVESDRFRARTAGERALREN